MKITNPEKECKTTPEIFSEESKITDIETADNRSGIILDSSNEVAKALIVWGYDGKAKVTQRFLMCEFGDKYHGIDEALLFVGGGEHSLDYKNCAYKFIKKLAKEALSELKSEGHFYKKLNYYEMNGTNFFGANNVYGYKVGDKYVLDSFSTPKKVFELAEKLGKPMALVSSKVEGKLSVVDDWWFNVNLEDVLASLPISKKQLERIPEYLTPGLHSGEYPKITFRHEKQKKQKFLLDISLDADTSLRPEGEEGDCEYIQARGRSIVGGAWTTYAKNGNDRIPPKAVQPILVISVSLPKRKIAVTEDQMESVQSARNYIASLLA
ncbi:MAG: hypothetical protein KKF74_04870 [Nanoarchaeota archaeon]|nr:hypothetical protein [Nanoarchaeota archaeon]